MKHTTKNHYKDRVSVSNLDDDVVTAEDYGIYTGNYEKMICEMTW